MTAVDIGLMWCNALLKVAKMAVCLKNTRQEEIGVDGQRRRLRVEKRV